MSLAYNLGVLFGLWQIEKEMDKDDDIDFEKIDLDEIRGVYARATRAQTDDYVHSREEFDEIVKDANLSKSVEEMLNKKAKCNFIRKSELILLINDFKAKPL